MLSDEGDMAATEAFEGARGLSRPQPAAVAKGGGEVALARLIELGLEAGDRPEVPGSFQPVLGVGQGVEDADRRHVFLEQSLHAAGALCLAGVQALDDGFAFDDLDVSVGREALVQRDRVTDELGGMAIAGINRISKG